MGCSEGHLGGHLAVGISPSWVVVGGFGYSGCHFGWGLISITTVLIPLRLGSS